ncbi:unnamed protein product [Echinostoma caproni]|uniref:MSP domain-containing protein n=1 Tax=Echinostoma caproni TaxID=27848 RepID=A0A183AAT0_9TREM|nr:unnamed protein product [Echinostoma caproni]
MDGYLRLGSSVIVVNPGPTSFYVKTGIVPFRAPYALSLGIINENVLRSRIRNTKEDFITMILESDMLKIVASSTLHPAVRNVFRVESCGNFHEGSPIRYGQPIMFVLEPTIESFSNDKNAKKRLFLASDLRRIGDPSLLMDTQSIYLELNEPSFAAQWCLEAADPNFRQEMEGRPVKLDEKLLIRHIRTNQALALEPKIMVRNAFGPDLGISVKTYVDPHKVERDVNLWLLTSATEPQVQSKMEPLSGSEACPVLTSENTSFECDVSRQKVDS